MIEFQKVTSAFGRVIALKGIFVCGESFAGRMISLPGCIARSTRDGKHNLGEGVFNVS
jgi:hypothetical protein